MRYFSPAGLPMKSYYSSGCKAGKKGKVALKHPRRERRELLELAAGMAVGLGGTAPLLPSAGGGTSRELARLVGLEEGTAAN